MKVPLFFMLATVAVTCAVIVTGGEKDQNASASTESHPAVVVAKEEVICEELISEPVEEFKPADVPEHETSWEQMVREVVLLWEKFFEMDEAPLNDRRRGNFELYAEYVADATITYQNKETNLGGRLPRHKNTHLLIATIITKESSVTPGVVGKKKEVGLMQLMPHGGAIAGMPVTLVRRKPKLNILLGARWLAVQVGKCHPKGIDDEDWTDDHWLGPISVYAGGQNGINQKTKRCKRFKLARERVGLVKMYRNWIDMEAVLDETRL